MQTGVEPAAAPRTWLGGIPAPWVATGLVFVAYAIATWGASTPYNSHTQLAWAMLHGTFDLRGTGVGTSEVVKGPLGQVYIVYGPGPSLLLLPVVWLFGPGLDQTMMSAAFGALAAGFWCAFLGRIGTRPASQAWLTALLAVGSPYFFCAAENGNNWSITTCTAVLFVMMAFYAGACDRPMLAGGAAAMATLCRYPVLLFAPAIGLLPMILEARSWREVRLDWPRLAWFAAGYALPMGFLCDYNWVRFGSLTSEGYKLYARTDPVARFGRKPLFSIAYLWGNLQSYLLTLPIVGQGFPQLRPGRSGMSMLIACPAYLLLARADWRRPAIQVAGASMLAVLGVYLLYFTDGVNQFGMRYAIDILPMLLLIVALRCSSKFGPLAKGLTVLGAAIEVWGFLTWRLLGWG